MEAFPNSEDGHHLQSDMKVEKSLAREGVDRDEGEMCFEEAVKKYKDARKLMTEAANHINKLVEDIDYESEFGKNICVIDRDIKYSGILMPGLIHAAVFKNLDNSVVERHIMHKALSESEIMDDGGVYIHDDFDDKAVTLVKEAIEIGSIQMLVNLKEALGSASTYSTSSGNGDAEDDYERARHIVQMEKEIKRLRQARDKMDKKYPQGK
jgi:hypothetical protein